MKPHCVFFCLQKKQNVGFDEKRRAAVFDKYNDAPTVLGGIPNKPTPMNQLSMIELYGRMRYFFERLLDQEDVLSEALTKVEAGESLTVDNWQEFTSKRLWPLWPSASLIGDERKMKSLPVMLFVKFVELVDSDGGLDCWSDYAKMDDIARMLKKEMLADQLQDITELSTAIVKETFELFVKEVHQANEDIKKDKREEEEDTAEEPPKKKAKTE